ncbi:hypothetical protein FHT44_005119 [Mycolicibacterium sp. BK634]|uniref:hypothetical protein n=1 Tax=Mycolicibacterium sp. BK634 TaxID=2587099 RepID=UPI0016156E27|nr:hypothetical protein [Mycolicibacterium sp. BK634]MBB3752607.1 hypothetical protein [Mycolicibacterium sp. BK634]
MKVVGLLNWYEESPAWLIETVASVSKLCDHIIAVDGPYAAFPGARKTPYSGSEQADAIFHTAAGLGMGCTIHTPRQPWLGGEVEKRDFMFRIGETFTTENDWYFRIDADEILTDVPVGTRSQLENSAWDVGEVTLWEREFNGESDFRCLFRARRGLEIRGNHYTVADGDRVLNGSLQVPALPLPYMRLEHRSHMRPAERQRLKKSYYELIPKLEVD